MMIALALVGFVGFISKAALTGLRAQPSTAGSIALMKIGLLYSTTTGNTETVAGYIAEAADVDGPHDASDVNNLSQFDGLIVGAPTWHTGADSERSGTSWDDWLYKVLPTIADSVKGKNVAIFGVGDAISYGDNFCDAMDELAECFEKAGAKLIGFTSTDGFEHSDSKALRDGKFCGLACDEDNQSDLSEQRVKAWIAQLKAEGMAF